MKTRWLILLGLVVFVYALITRAPLAVVYGYLRPQSATVDVVGIQGTLQKGSAAGIVADGQTAVRNLHWQLRSLQLLLGRAAFHITADGDGLVLEGDAALPVTGGVHLSDLRASSSMKPLLTAFKLFLPIDGQLGIDAQKVVLRKGLPTTAQGHLSLNGLSWKLGRDPLVLGDYEADVVPADDGLAATIKALRGPLDVSGTAAFKADSSYELHLQIRAKSDAPPPLVNMLASLGAPDNQGYYHIRRNGQLATPAVQAAQPPPD